jgi:hypothetical protein
MPTDAKIDYEDAVRAVANYLAVGAPPTVTEFNKARKILWGTLSDEDRSRAVMR